MNRFSFMRATVHLCHKCHRKNQKTKLNFANGNTFVDIFPLCGQSFVDHGRADAWSATLSYGKYERHERHSFFFLHGNKVILCRCFRRRAICQSASFIFIYESQTEPHHKRPISLQKKPTRTTRLREALICLSRLPYHKRFFLPFFHMLSFC